MGLIDVIDQLNLSDDEKEKLRQEHESEIGSVRQENLTLKARDRRSSVEEEVQGLAGLGLSDSPGLLKFYRRCLLSDDEEPGAVLLSDSELNLSGDVATGATGKEEISVAGALRKFVELLPRSGEGKLQLSDQALVANADNPPPAGDGTDEESVREKRRESAAGWMGKSGMRKRGGDA